MIDKTDNRFGTCKNCGHAMRVQVDHKNEKYLPEDYWHFTRAYRPWGYPYTTHDCHKEGCTCTTPEA